MVTDNRIQHIEIRDGVATAASAEVWVRAEVDRITSGTELRGRLMGPRCRFAATVEVAYPLRPFPRVPAAMEGLSGRVVIPEASLWEPECPFLYEGPIELWQDGRLCERVVVSHGLRTLALGPGGLRVNGRRLALRGRSVATLSEDEAISLRAAGVNLLLAPVAAATMSLWPLADRLGFLVIGQVDDAAEAMVKTLAAHPSCFGWIAPPADVARWTALGRVGVALGARPTTPLPDGVAFVVGDGELADLQLPVIARANARPESPGIVGTIE